MTPEFPRPERVDTIGERDRTVVVAANVEERAALARRFGLIGIDRLDARFTLRRDGRGVIAQGEVSAEIVQACSVTGDALTARIAEPVSLRFAEDAAGDADEIELDADALDTMAIEDGAIDLGEAAAETMALALDPFPRGPNAAAALRAAGVISDEEARPLGALAGLRAKLEGR